MLPEPSEGTADVSAIGAAGWNRGRRRRPGGRGSAGGPGGALAYQETWDILRLCGFHDPRPVAIAALPEGRRLCVCRMRLGGAGAYMVSRCAAEVLMEKLVPMTLPPDHALDREWAYGLRAAAVIPLPIAQDDRRFPSQIGTRASIGASKLPWYRRYWTVLPWRAWIEVTRFIQRRRQLSRARALLRRGLVEAGRKGIWDSGL